MKPDSAAINVHSIHTKARPLSGWNLTLNPILFAEDAISRSVGLITLLLSCLQSLALNFEVAMLSQTSDSDDPKTSLTGLLRVILTRREFGVQKLDSTDLLIILALTAYIVVYLGINSIIFYRMVLRVSVSDNLPRIWRSWGYIHLFVMSLPIHDFTLEFAYISLNLSQPSAGRLIGSLLAILIAALNGALSLIHLKLSFVIKTKDPFSRTNNIYLISFFLTKIILSTLNCLALHSQNHKEWSIILSVISFIISIINQAFLSYSLPFYKTWVNQIFSYVGTFNIIISFIAILFLIANIISEGSTSTTILLFGFLLFIGFGSKLNRSYFDSQIARLTPEHFFSKLSLSQTYRLIQRLGFLKTLLSKTVVPDTSEKKFQISGLLQAGYAKEIIGFLNSDQVASKSLPNKRGRRERIYQLYYQAISHNPKNHLLRLVLANYLIKDSKNIYEPSLLIQQVLSDRDAPFRIKFSAAYLQKKLKNLIENNMEVKTKTMDLKAYFYSTNMFEEFKRLLDYHLTLLEKFYKLLEDMAINSSSLVRLSAKLQRSSTRIHKFWESIPYNITEKKGAFYLGYAIFNACFSYDLKMGRIYLNKYKSLLRKNIENYKSNTIDDINLHDDHNISFFLKGDLNSLGEIVDCSSNIKNSLGYPKGTLIGKNINLILPPFFQGVLTDIMKRKLESNDDLFNIDYIDCFTKDQNGFISPVKNMVTMYPTFENGLLFWSLMRNINSEFDYMLVGENGVIEGFSQKLQYDLWINPNEKITLNRLCPSLAKLERIMELISTNKLENSNEEEVEEQEYVKPYTRSIEGEDLSRQYDSDQITMAQEVLHKGRPFGFKPRKIGTKRNVTSYICRCKIQNHEGRLLKVYVLQKINIHVASISQVSQTRNQASQAEVERKISDEYNISLEEFQEPTKENKAHPTEHAKSPALFIRNVQAQEEIIKDNDETITRKTDLKSKVKRLASLSSYTQIEGSGTPTFDYQSSMKSDISESRRRGETLDNLLKYLRFYKFSEVKAPFFFIAIYLITLLSTIWLVYDGASSSIPQIKGTVEVFTTMLERSNTAYAVMKDHYLIYLAGILAFDHSRFIESLNTSLTKLSEYNADLVNKIRYLEPATRELFFADNIKIYYDGFDDIKTSQDYTLLDSMGSLNEIITIGLYYAKHSADPDRASDKRFKYSEEYLFQNLYNDYLLKNEQLQGTISTDLKNKADNIEQRCNNFITITSISFGIAVFVLSGMLYLVYKRTCHFLQDFINGGYETELPELYSQLNQFKALLENNMDLAQSKNSFQRTSTSKSLSKLQKKGYNFGKNRYLEGMSIFFQYCTLCVLTVILLTVGLVILILASITYKERTHDILPFMNDITQAANISQQTQSTLSVLTLYVFKPTYYYKYGVPSDILTQYIEEMSDIVSLERTHFTSDFHAKMNTDICSYIDLSFFPNCSTVLTGIAKEGIISSVIVMENIIMSFKNKYDLTPPSPYKPFIAMNEQDIKDCNLLVYDGLAPAISSIISMRTNELSNMLDESSQIVIKYAIIGNIIAVLIVIFALFYLYPALLAQRKTISRSMLLLPPQLIIRNRYLKEFLLREDKRFFSFIKMTQEEDQVYTIENLLGKKTKVIITKKEE